jgi:hypothetical protein
MAVENRHFEQSTYREHVVEHLFMARLLEAAWLERRPPIEVLRCEADMHGYDIVLAVGDVVRHIQLKASTDTAKAAFQKVHIGLADKPAGCVVWVAMKEREDRCALELSYSYFGGAPGSRLPLRADHRVARHTKANVAGLKAERPNIREIPRRDFRPVKDMSELLKILFGEVQ